MSMDAQAIDDIRARRAAITPGKWRIDDDEPNMVFAQDGWWNGKEFVAECGGCERPGSEIHANAEFIAHAPTDIDTLLAEVERLRLERDAAQREVEAYRHSLTSVQGLYALDRVIPEERDSIRLFFPLLGDSEEAQWERRYQELLPQLSYADLGCLQDAVAFRSIPFVTSNLLKLGLVERTPDPQRESYRATAEGRRVNARYTGAEHDDSE